MAQSGSSAREAEEPRAEREREEGEAGVGPGMTDELTPDPEAKPRDFSRPDELGRRALNQARAAAKKHGYRPRASRLTRPKGDPRGERAQGAGYSGAGPDPRDPQRLNTVLEKMLVNLGWDRGLSAGRVLAEWDDIVGPAIAQHCHIESFEEGVLVVSTDSSAWAAQLRMLSPQIVTRIHERVGAQVVSEIKVAGPSTQSWKKGSRTVTWRGPRDTYG
ncbi:DciA family protein [Dermabacter sp. Marseille-Q3180]|uniref:DUF721 domain-containing protein n=1 Tax=Dermabacter sp. Marseille-Q3180 TaxID=2758090 RepID=UPI0020246FCD|nr:DciA family protein [Dermabacter sp. Marseille-Q3180]